MSGFVLRKNIIFDWSGSKFRIDRLHENGDVVLERFADGLISVITRQVLLTAYRKGEITAAVESGTSTPPIKVFSRPLDELSELVQQEVTRRRHYLQAICDAGHLVFTKAHLGPVIRHAAAEIGDPKPPSVTSIYRWHHRY